MDSIGSLNPAGAMTARDGAKLDNLRMMTFSKDDKLDEKKMRKIANQFESMIFRQLLKEMRKTIPNYGAIEKSHATKMYEDITDDYMAENLAETNDLGIEQVIMQELKDKQRQQERLAEREANGGFMNLQGRQKELKPEDFMPLQPDTNTFINLNHDPKMLELPAEREPFVPLDSKRPVPTSKIDFSQ